MSETPYLGEGIDLILGQDFLTWLWFKSEAGRGSFETEKGVPFALYMEQRISVQGGEGESLETATVSGPMSELREARMGLTTGKKVSRALLRLERDGEAWSVTVRAQDFQLNSFKTPVIEKEQEDDEPDARFLEKIYLVEQGLQLVDCVFTQFLRVRLNAELWRDEVRAFRRWLQESEA